MIEASETLAAVKPKLAQQYRLPPGIYRFSFRNVNLGDTVRICDIGLGREEHLEVQWVRRQVQDEAGQWKWANIPLGLNDISEFYAFLRRLGSRFREEMVWRDGKLLTTMNEIYDEDGKLVLGNQGAPDAGKLEETTMDRADQQSGVDSSPGGLMPATGFGEEMELDSNANQPEPNLPLVPVVLGPASPIGPLDVVSGGDGTADPRPSENMIDIRIRTGPYRDNWETRALKIGPKSTAGDLIDLLRDLSIGEGYILLIQLSEFEPLEDSACLKGGQSSSVYRLFGLWLIRRLCRFVFSTEVSNA
jgi:hypothetical protein